MVVENDEDRMEGENQLIDIGVGEGEEGGEGVWNGFLNFFFQAEGIIWYLVRSRGLGNVYKRRALKNEFFHVFGVKFFFFFFLKGIMLSLIHI